MSNKPVNGDCLSEQNALTMIRSQIRDRIPRIAGIRSQFRNFSPENPGIISRFGDLKREKRVGIRSRFRDLIRIEDAEMSRMIGILQTRHQF